MAYRAQINVYGDSSSRGNYYFGGVKADMTTPSSRDMVDGNRGTIKSVIQSNDSTCVQVGWVWAPYSANFPFYSPQSFIQNSSGQIRFLGDHPWGTLKRYELSCVDVANQFTSSVTNSMFHVKINDTLKDVLMMPAESISANIRTSEDWIAYSLLGVCVAASVAAALAFSTQAGRDLMVKLGIMSNAYSIKELANKATTEIEMTKAYNTANNMKTWANGVNPNQLTLWSQSTVNAPTYNGIVQILQQESSYNEALTRIAYGIGTDPTRLYGGGNWYTQIPLFTSAIMANPGATSASLGPNVSVRSWRGTAWYLGLKQSQYNDKNYGHFENVKLARYYPKGNGISANDIFGINRLFYWSWEPWTVGFRTPVRDSNILFTFSNGFVHWEAKTTNYGGSWFSGTRNVEYMDQYYGNTTNQDIVIGDTGTSGTANSAIGQKFTAGKTGKLTQVIVRLNGGMPSAAPITVEILNNLGSVLATTTTPGSTAFGTYPNHTAKTIRFTTPPSVVAGTQYILRLRLATKPSAGYRYIWRAMSGNPYSGGDAIIYTNPTSTTGTTLTGYDMTFFTYVTVTETIPNPTPILEDMTF